MHINKDIVYYFLIALDIMLVSVIGYYEYQAKQDKIIIVSYEQSIQDETVFKNGVSTTTPNQ